MHRSADETTLRGHQTLRSRNSKFNRLSRTRPVGMSQGPISYLALVRYADEMGMGPGEKEFLWDVVKKLDSHFLAEVARRNKPPPTTNKPPPPRRR